MKFRIGKKRIHLRRYIECSFRPGASISDSHARVSLSSRITNEDERENENNVEFEMTPEEALELAKELQDMADWLSNEIIKRKKKT